jgi:hypothetical protein
MGGTESAQGIERKQPIDPKKQNQNQTKPTLEMMSVA